MWFLVIAIRNEDFSTEYWLKSCQTLSVYGVGIES
jgi:hypothetical protein